MLRDLTMIFSVLVSVVSLVFGVYKNIEAGNARGFAYEQAYRVMNVIRNSDIGPAAKENMLTASLAALGTPPPVIDLSRSSADTPTEPGPCTEVQMDVCVRMAGELAKLNALCARSAPDSAVCLEADARADEIGAGLCITCFVR